MGSSTRHNVIKVSAREQALIDLIPKAPGRINTNELVAIYYSDDNEPPLNARAILVGRLRGIAAKAERGKWSWRLRNSSRAGPHPQEFWVVDANQ